jgi:hypothetical protein
MAKKNKFKVIRVQDQQGSETIERSFFDKQKNLKNPQLDPKIRETIENLIKLSKIWNVGRQGIIINFNGARVGNWKWDTNRMIINTADNPGGKKFKDLVNRLNKEGVMTSFIKSREGKDGIPGISTGISTQISYRLTRFSKLSPGELDRTMRANGYFVIDNDLPFISEGEEGVSLRNPLSDTENSNVDV